MAFGGLLTAGKDAAADHLVGQGWVKVGMSDVLNEAVLALNPIIGVQPMHDGSTLLGEQLLRYRDLVEQVGYTEAKQHIEVRRMLQRFGTEVGRQMFGEDFWVDRISERIESLLEAGNDVALTGLRFPNEVAMAERLGGLSVWVSRPTVRPTAIHVSEKSVDESVFDAVLMNDGTLDDLGDAVDALIFEHFGNRP